MESSFEGFEALHREISKLPKYGNDDLRPDSLAREIGQRLLDALDCIPTDPGVILYGSFYSLLGHQNLGKRLPATPDGRRAGQPLSENQSPAYGADEKGLTALLQSVAHLPFDRAASGTLNIRLSPRTPPEKIAALITSFFHQGGAILGLSFADRATLEDALKNPHLHQTLYVRMYGFSEFFTALPRNEQLEVIARTEY